MSKPEYVSLHNHAESSVLDGLAKNEEYLDRIVELGQPGMGITDHGNLFSIYKFLKACQERGLGGVPGIEAYVAPINPEGAKVKQPVFYGRGGRKGKYDVSRNGSYLHLTMWAINNEGLNNLFKMSTLSYDQSRFYGAPRIDFDIIEEHSKGIVVSTGCPSSEISTRFLLGQDKKAYEYAGRLKEVFGPERLFVEVMDHNMGIDLERKLLPKQVELAKKMGLKLLATNDAHYALQKDSIHHEEMLCVQSGSIMSDKTYDEGGTRFKFEGDQYYLKTAEQMAELFPESDYPNALKSSLEIMEMAQDVKVGFDPDLKPHAILPEGKDEVEFFKELINIGFKERLEGKSKEHKEEAKIRINEEFKVIHSSNFIGYFIVVWEYLKWVRDNFSTLSPSGEVLALPHGPGRGSVGGSMIAYLLKISELDPITHDLIFERFLSAGRGATYRITYDDGTTEELIVSEEKKVLCNGRTESQYIHQLELGDEILFEEL